MAEHVVTDNHTPSMTQQIKRIIEEGQTLIRQEFELAKAEAREQWHRAVKAMMFFVTAVVFAVFAVALLTLAGVHLLEWLTHLPLWICYAITGGSCSLLALATGAWAYRKVKHIEVMHYTTETMKENVQWIKNQT
jgi:uncharacterized membrane protein YqjE